MSQDVAKCRQIAEADLSNVTDLLTAGFRRQKGGRRFWECAINQLTTHPTPSGYPRYGYILESGGSLVGAVLQIFTQIPGTSRVRCSFSGWFVQPRFRLYAGIMINRALAHDADYTNITAARNTWGILEAQGYKKYCNGQTIGIPLFAFTSEAAKVTRFSEDVVPGADLSLADITTLRDHAGYGCISLICEAGGDRFSFVFRTRSRLGIKVAFLTYCSASATVPRFARALGWYLAKRGIMLIAFDCDSRAERFPGVYGEKPKYFKGRHRPRIGDHSYSERALFGA